MTGWWWVSTKRMTFAVEVTDGIVTQAAPIARKFIGQPSGNLGLWLKKQPGFRWAPLTKEVEA